MVSFVHLLLMVLAWTIASSAATNVMEADEGICMGCDFDCTVCGGQAVERAGVASPEMSAISVNRRQKRIVHGVAVALQEYPFVAELRFRVGERDNITHRHSCGANIISEKFLVTAAHCVKKDRPKHLYVVVGQFDNVSPDGTEQMFEIETVAIHPSYMGSSNGSSGSYGDVAVIKIKPDIIGQYIRYNEAVQPIRLPDKGMELAEGTYCYVLGWGRMKDMIGSKKLQGAKVPVINSTTCEEEERYGERKTEFNITEKEFCAGNLAGSGGIDACYGDSGGPFACKMNGTMHLMGVVSKGLYCGQHGHPTIYTKLSKYVDWVHNITMEWNADQS